MKNDAIMSKEERIDQMRRYLLEKFQLPRDQVDVMLPKFISTLVSHMENIEDALSEGDTMVIGKNAHTMKGALLNLGLHDCAEIARDLEEKGKAGDASVDYSALVGHLRTTLGELVSQ
ncbi:Hpt domain-containing protein [Desulfosediminicola flagellatus]|uniref:Hpt domain-containing protein n=1 Tax=Desulfosediminicola flagellatus TaxID=2569541 RepID=UPI0010AD5A58|nr:Hpt domain-containing protein [Desulfosediminicola flagellatus]